MIMNVPTQEEIKQIKNDLSGFKFRVNPTTGKPEKSVDGGQTWTNFSGGEEPVLLWTNSSPSTAFAAQTVSLNLSDYNQLIIVAVGGTSMTSKRANLMDKGTTNVISAAVNNGTSATTRSVTSSNTGVTFATGYNNNTAGTNYCIPVEIWGCKGKEAPRLQFLIKKSDNTKSVDLSSVLPNYGSYTLSDLVVEWTKITAYYNSTGTYSPIPVATYNSSTGVLSFNTDSCGFRTITLLECNVYLKVSTS